MASRSIEAGRAFLRLQVDDKLFAKGLEKSVAKIKAFGQGLSQTGQQLGRIGVFISAPFGLAIRALSQQATPAGKKMAAALDSIKQSATQVGAAIGAAVLPAIQKFAGFLTANLGTIVEWIKANSTLVSVVGALGLALTTLSPILIVVGGSIKLLSVAIGFLGGAMSLVSLSPILIFLPAVAVAIATAITRTKDLTTAMRVLARVFEIITGFKLPEFKAPDIKGIEKVTDAINAQTEAVKALQQANEAQHTQLAKDKILRDAAGNRPFADALSTAFGLGFGRFPFGGAVVNKAPPLQRGFAIPSIPGGTTPGFFGPGFSPLAISQFANEWLEQWQQNGPLGQIRSTFGGRFANQIFGAGNTQADRDRREQLRLSRLMEEHLKIIRQQKAGLKAGGN